MQVEIFMKRYRNTKHYKKYFENGMADLKFNRNLFAPKIFFVEINIKN